MGTVPSSLSHNYLSIYFTNSSLIGVAGLERILDASAIHVVQERKSGGREKHALHTFMMNLV